MRYAIYAYEGVINDGRFFACEVGEFEVLYDAERKASKLSSSVLNDNKEVHDKFNDLYWEDDDDWDQTASYLRAEKEAYKIWPINESAAQGMSNEELKKLFESDVDGFTKKYCDKIAEDYKGDMV